MYRLIIWIIKRFMKKPEILGMENIQAGEPAIFVSNHLGYYAPLKIIVFSNLGLIPWVTYEVTDMQYCKRYLMDDFIEPQMGLRYPISNIVAAIITPLCVFVMNQLHAVPVYYKSRRIFETVDQSVRLLEQGKSLLIFPEIAEADPNVLGVFREGFVYVARAYFERSHKAACFYPMGVNKKNNQIVIGSRISFDPSISIWQEKRRIVDEIKKSISQKF